jgi:hypothetical protein
MITLPALTGEVECRYCVDGYQPLRLDPVLGPLYAICPTCVEPCPACNYRGVCVSTCCLPHFTQRLRSSHAVRPYFCAFCGALVEVRDESGQVLWS